MNIKNKKRKGLHIIVVMLCLCFCFALAACPSAEEQPPAREFDVDFIFDGAVYHTVSTFGNEIITLPLSPQKVGYNFEGWYYDNNVWSKSFTENSLLEITLTESVKVYAKWAVKLPEEYIVSFVSAGDEIESKSHGLYDFIKKPSDPTRDHHSFVGWYKDDNYSVLWNFAEDRVIDNTTLYARWNARSYYIFYYDAGEHENPNEYTVEMADIVLADAEKDGYEFLGWYLDSEHKTEATIIDTSKGGVVYLYGKWLELGYGGGDGTVDNPYLIETRAQLETFAGRVDDYNVYYNKYFKLTQDIDLDGDEWTPIGEEYYGFEGVFDGDGHTISNFRITAVSEYDAGLFGSNYGEIKNLGVEDFVININNTGSSVYFRCGGLVGKNEGTLSNCFAKGDITTRGMDGYVGLLAGESVNTIANCYSDGSIDTSAYDAGGLAGYNSGKISDSYANVDILAVFSAGGLVSRNSLFASHAVRVGTIINCYATGDITVLNTRSNYSYAGGLVAENSDGIIKNSHATGTVSLTAEFGDIYCGGLIGENYSGTIENCYATGDVSATTGASYTKVGGLVGSNIFCTITNCFATGNVSASSTAQYWPSSYVGGLVGYGEADILNCYATGDVNSFSPNAIYAGGLAGLLDGSAICTYATGNVSVEIYITEVSGYAMAGGLIGYTTSSLLANSYATGDVSVINACEDSTTYVGFLIGYNSWTDVVDCYRYAGQSMNLVYEDYEDVRHNDDGIQYAESFFADQNFYKNTLKWSGVFWDFSGELSYLRGPTLVVFAD